MYLRRGRSVPCVHSSSADPLLIDISRRDMVKHDRITQQTSPLRQHYFSNLPLKPCSKELDYRPNLMVLYHRANHSFNLLSDSLSSSERTGTPLECRRACWSLPTKCISFPHARNPDTISQPCTVVSVSVGTVR